MNLFKKKSEKLKGKKIECSINSILASKLKITNLIDRNPQNLPLKLITTNDISNLEDGLNSPQALE